MIPFDLANRLSKPNLLELSSAESFIRCAEINRTFGMTRVEQLEQAVAALPFDEYRQFRDWFIEREWAEWDRQIEADSSGGKLDFLIDEANAENSQGGALPL